MAAPAGTAFHLGLRVGVVRGALGIFEFGDFPDWGFRVLGFGVWGFRV